jgi:hypothetical protein
LYLKEKLMKMLRQACGTRVAFLEAMTPQALMLSLLCTFRPALALPSVDAPDAGLSVAMFESPSAGPVARDDSPWLAPGGVGALRIAGWLLSASVYGLALTASLPEIVEGDPQLTVVRLARGEEGTGSLADLSPWAASLARSVGVVMVSLDGGGAGHGGARLALYPIGPASSAGLSVSGTFD